MVKMSFKCVSNKETIEVIKGVLGVYIRMDSHEQDDVMFCIPVFVAKKNHINFRVWKTQTVSFKTCLSSEHFVQ